MGPKDILTTEPNACPEFLVDIFIDHVFERLHLDLPPLERTESIIFQNVKMGTTGSMWYKGWNLFGLGFARV